MSLIQRYTGGKQFRLEMQQFTKIVVFVLKFDVCMVSWPHPDIPDLGYVGVDLFLEDLTSLCDVVLDIFKDLEAFKVLLVFEHDHLDLLTRVLQPEVFCHAVESAHVEVVLG